MTNFEKYKDEILKIIANSDYEIVAVKNGAPVPCDDIECGGCDIRDKSENGACASNLIKWLYEDDGKTKTNMKGCAECAHASKTIHEYPCSECGRSYPDKFELEPKKTRQSEFLKAYPNANVLGIQPCAIEGESFRCRDGCEPCSECARAYWEQEVE